MDMAVVQQHPLAIASNPNIQKQTAAAHLRQSAQPAAVSLWPLEVDLLQAALDTLTR
jgi:hypothetical protein